MRQTGGKYGTTGYEFLASSLRSIMLNATIYQTALCEPMNNKSLEKAILLGSYDASHTEKISNITKDDDEMMAALKYIKENSSSLIQVEDVVRAANTSRRYLERRFKKELGYSILQIIKKLHIEQMKRMLVETNFSIKKIAFALGHSGTDNISRYFKHETGLSPKQYRQKNGNNRLC